MISYTNVEIQIRLSICSNVLQCRVVPTSPVMEGVRSFASLLAQQATRPRVEEGPKGRGKGGGYTSDPKDQKGFATDRNSHLQNHLAR